MADIVGTRFGVLGRELSLAVLYTVELTAREGVDALDRADRRVHAGIADALVPAETPGQRWRMLLESLFPTSTMLIDRHTPPPVELGDLDGDPAHERIIRKILTAAAAFLLAESTTLEDTLSMHAMVDTVEESVNAELDELLQTAAAASATLLEHAENGTWRTLLPPLQAAGDSAERTAVQAAAAPRRTVAIGMWLSASGAGKTFSHSVAWTLVRELERARAAGRIPEVWALGPDLSLASRLGELLGELTEHDEARRDLRLPLRVHYVLPERDPGLVTPKPAGGGMAYIDLPGFRVVDGQSRVEALRTCLIAARRERGVPLDRLIVAGAEHDTAPGADRTALLGGEVEADVLGLTGCEVTLAGRHTRESLRFWQEQFAAAGARQLSIVGDVRRRGIGRLRRAVIFSASTTWNIATGATASWSTTARAALLMAVCTVGAVLTILALGYAELNGYALLLVLIGFAGMTLTNLRPRPRDNARISTRRSMLLPVRQREDTTV